MNQIDVDTRDYHHLFRFEIGGGKRISRHLSDCGHVERRFHVIIAASRTRIWRQQGLGCRDQRLSIE